MNPNPNPDSSDVLVEFPHLFRKYKDGRIERFLGTETTPAGTDPRTGVQSKDVTINAGTGVGARLYLPPNAASSAQKLPLLIYIHGGAFCVCTPYNPGYHLHMNTVAAAANVVVVSVHYRLAPEHPLPIAYDDTWEAIQWAAAHAAASGGGPEPWLNDHADFGKVFFAGDSAGANLAHSMGMRGASEGFGGLKLNGLVLIHPYFGNEERDKLVEFLYPAYGGVDDPKIHATRDPKISGLGCGRVLVMVAGKDFLRDRGRSYYEVLKKSGWNGVVDMVESEGEDHVFHLFDPTKENSAALVKQFVSFMKQV
ncbi:probable carboxylesterase 12 [Gastrolobium bilobum]|uniref:probable carboxylesterase 12 n=1 Tax=Gastrolobium bilobum TaxID=150636 RepID=UPI002AAFC9B4|nr:probable carboxylesterase 12 [Gastrolobium bilobum]